MGIQNCISRRSLLSMSAGAAGLIVGGGPQASSQPGKRIDQYPLRGNGLATCS